MNTPIKNMEATKYEPKCPTCDKLFTDAESKGTIGLAIEHDYMESFQICDECSLALADMNKEQRFYDFYNWLIEEVARAKQWKGKG
jgi:hypothetical protein